jgi:tetratricopeptide (TPR) repeat protein
MKRSSLTLAFCLGVPVLLAAQVGLSPWSLSVSPSAYFPLVGWDGSPSTRVPFSAGYGSGLGLEYDIEGRLPLAARLSLGYAYSGLAESKGVAIGGGLQELQLLAGLSGSMAIGRTLSLQAFLEGGCSYGMLSSGDSSPLGLVKAGVGASARLGSSLSARLETAAEYKVGMSGGLAASLALGYRLPSRVEKVLSPAKLHLLRLDSMETVAIFPIFRSYYDEHSLGSVRVTNAGKEAATDLQISFYARQYMDAPKASPLIDRLEPGQSVTVPLYALFNDAILNVTEATKVSGEVSVACAQGDEASQAGTVMVYDRNALTWSDDRHAAAFVSSKDPWVMDLVGNFMAAVKDSRNPELAKNLETGMAIHGGLKVYGLSYQLSPNRPFAQQGGNLETVDSLKFPRQTLSFRSGDCADLSVLFASCFEAAGIETAFVTVPGHIFMAFDLGLSAEEVKARAMPRDQLVIVGDKVWVPIETTMRNAGFVEAWSKAAEEWRSSLARNESAIYPIHEAWEAYAPVGLPADGSSAKPPSADAVKYAFSSELAAVVKSELSARLAALGPLPEGGKNAQTYAKAMNDRGVLYAKYGNYAEAEKAFSAAVQAGNATALVNLGNLALLGGEAAKALAYFQQATKKLSGNARLLILVAKAAAVAGATDTSNSAIAAALALDPSVAALYGKANGSAVVGTRAAFLDDMPTDWF